MLYVPTEKAMGATERIRSVKCGVYGKDGLGNKIVCAGVVFARNLLWGFGRPALGCDCASSCKGGGAGGPLVSLSFSGWGLLHAAVGINVRVGETPTEKERDPRTPSPSSSC